MPYRIGPSQLGCRENPYGKATAPNPDNARICLSRIDPRQRGLFNCAWMVGYVAALARGGIAAVALAAPTGPFGYIYRRMDFRQPHFDELGHGAIYPAFHVLAGLAALSGTPLRKVEVSGDGAIDAIATSSGGKTVLWLANLTGGPRSVKCPDGTSAVAILDEPAFEPATTDPHALQALQTGLKDPWLELDAYAVARCEIG